MRILPIALESCYHETNSQKNVVQDPTLREDLLAHWRVDPEALRSRVLRVGTAEGGNPTTLSLPRKETEGRSYMNVSQRVPLGPTTPSKWCVGARLRTTQPGQRVVVGATLICRDQGSAECEYGFYALTKAEAQATPGSWQWVGGIVEVPSHVGALGVYVELSGSEGEVAIDRVVAASLE